MDGDPRGFIKNPIQNSKKISTNKNLTLSGGLNK